MGLVGESLPPWTYDSKEAHPRGGLLYWAGGSPPETHTIYTHHRRRAFILAISEGETPDRNLSSPSIPHLALAAPNPKAVFVAEYFPKRPDIRYERWNPRSVQRSPRRRRNLLPFLLELRNRKLLRRPLSAVKCQFDRKLLPPGRKPRAHHVILRLVAEQHFVLPQVRRAGELPQHRSVLAVRVDPHEPAKLIPFEEVRRGGVSARRHELRRCVDRALHEAGTETRHFLHRFERKPAIDIPGVFRRLAQQALQRHDLRAGRSAIAQ